MGQSWHEYRLHLALRQNQCKILPLHPFQDRNEVKIQIMFLHSSIGQLFNYPLLLKLSGGWWEVPLSLAYIADISHPS